VVIPLDPVVGGDDSLPHLPQRRWGKHPDQDTDHLLVSPVLNTNRRQSIHGVGNVHSTEVRNRGSTVTYDMYFIFDDKNTLSYAYINFGM